MKITRKQFLERLIGGAAGVFGVAMVVGCSSGTDNGSSGGNPDAATASDASRATSCTMNGTTSTIAANHGHVLMVSKADVTAGAAKSYDITGSADHPHTVMVTAAMFTQLKGNTSVSMTSTNNSGHSHTVTVMCA